MKDERIVSEIINGNAVVMGEMINKYSRLLWTIAGAVLNGVGTAQDIEECVADAFIYIWEHPDKFDPELGRLKTWLSIVARTKAINRSRDISRRNTAPLDDALLVEQLGIIDNILEKETRRTLLAAVNALGEPEREILIRRYYFDQKPKEIALALGLSVKQVDNHLFRTKRKLREAVSN